MAPMPPGDSGIYTALQTDPFEIRLLRIERDRSVESGEGYLVCGLEIFELGEAPPYRCLSYVWGTEEWYEIKVRVNHEPDLKSLDVSTNLLRFLRRMHDRPEDLISTSTKQCTLCESSDRRCQCSKYAGGYLWIDAICLNQSDMREKGDQIPQMGDIFSRAEQVFAWLGCEGDLRGDGAVFGEDEESAQALWGDKAVHYMRKLATAINAWELQDDEDFSVMLRQHPYNSPEMFSMLNLEPPPDETWAAIAFLLNRRWFQRTWIVQEAVLAKDIVLVCGWEIFTWEEIVPCVSFILQSGWYTVLSSFVVPVTQRIGGRVADMGSQVTRVQALREYYHGIERSALRFSINILSVISLRDCSLSELLYRLIVYSRSFGTSEPRDKVFGPVALLRQMPQAARTADFPALDYSAEIINIYVDVTTYLLRETGSLDILTHTLGDTAQGHSSLSAEQTSRLPSWVPDFSQTMSNSLILVQNAFNAAAWKPTRNLTFPTRTTLSLSGIRFSTITNLAQPFSEIPSHRDWRSLITFCLSLNPVYPTGEDRTEAFWRTIIADGAFSAVPAHPLLGHYFNCYLLFRAAFFAVGSADEWIEPPYTSWHEWTCFDELHSSSEYAAKVIPSTASLAAAAVERLQLANAELPEEDVKNFLKAVAFGDMYGDQYALLSMHRRLFVTEGGYLGVGNAAAEIGDEVWFLPGGKVPFLLRPVEDAEGGKTFKVVGEAYLHGFMFGEIFERKTDDDLERISIV